MIGEVDLREMLEVPQGARGIPFPIEHGGRTGWMLYRPDLLSPGEQLELGHPGYPGVPCSSGARRPPSLVRLNPPLLALCAGVPSTRELASDRSPDISIGGQKVHYPLVHLTALLRGCSTPNGLPIRALWARTRGRLLHAAEA
jgi:hypothetical protein